MLKARFHDAVTDVLREGDRAYLNMGSFSLQKEGVAGLEADVSFYLDDLEGIGPIVDLAEMRAPDLAIEIDLTSQTDVDRYLPFAVPEVWIYKRGKMTIYCLSDGEYRVSDTSQWFSLSELERILAAVHDIDPYS